MKTTPEQEQLVVGTLLGDGYLYPNGRLQLERQEKFKAYLMWKYERLQSITSGIPKRCVRFDKRTKREYVSWRFYTKAIFPTYRQWFYPNGRKVVPACIAQLLTTPLALAVWFMDDGGRGARTPKGMIISAAGFSKADSVIATAMFGDQLSTESKSSQERSVLHPGSFERALFQARYSSYRTVNAVQTSCNPVTTEALRRDSSRCSSQTGKSMAVIIRWLLPDHWQDEDIV